MARHLSWVKERRTSDEQELAAAHPGLRLMPDEAGRIRIEGILLVPLPSGRSVEHEISIEYAGTDPFMLPYTYDRVGRFEREPDNHVEGDGRFCMWLPQTAPVADFKRPGGLSRYISHVQEFIRLQLVYETRRKHGVHPYWPGKEWEHGDAGHKQWFKENARSLTFTQFKSLLDAVNTRPSGKSRCPCGSGKTLKECHQRWLKKVRMAVAGSPRVLDLGYAVAREMAR